MLIRTYIRTLFNKFFVQNFIVRFLGKIVNFYCEVWFNPNKNIKFEQKLPINKMEKEHMLFFQSVTGDKVDCK